MLGFIHIPKTAGTSFHKVLWHQYRPREIRIHHDTSGVLGSERIDDLKSRGVRLLMGHMSVGAHQHNENFRYLTCLREPVARLESLFRHAVNDCSHYLHHDIVTRGLSLANCVEGKISGEMNNGMTRMLAGVRDFHHAPVDDETLEKAKENLKHHFEGVLISEDFDRGVLMLARRLGWSTPYYIRRRVGKYPKHRERRDDATRSVIEAGNAHDLELYHWAKRRFEEEASEVEGLEQETGRFRSRNAGVGKAVFIGRELMRRIEVGGGGKLPEV